MNVMRVLFSSAPRLSLYLLIIGLLSACQHLNKLPTSAISIDEWQALGRIALQTTDSASGATSAESVRIQWTQNGDSYRIELSGSFGFGRTSIVGNDKLVSLLKGSETIAASDNPDELLRQQTGLQIPVSRLRYWALGLPSAQNTLPPANGCGELKACDIPSVESDGWVVTYPETVVVSNRILPRKIIAARPDLRLVIKISDWSGPTNEP